MGEDISSPPLALAATVAAAHIIAVFPCIPFVCVYMFFFFFFHERHHNLSLRMSGVFDPSRIHLFLVLQHALLKCDAYVFNALCLMYFYSGVWVADFSTWPVVHSCRISSHLSSCILSLFNATFRVIQWFCDIDGVGDTCSGIAHH